MRCRLLLRRHQHHMGLHERRAVWNSFFCPLTSWKAIAMTTATFIVSYMKKKIKIITREGTVSPSEIKCEQKKKKIDGMLVLMKPTDQQARSAARTGLGLDQKYNHNPTSPHTLCDQTAGRNAGQRTITDKLNPYLCTPYSISHSRTIQTRFSGVTRGSERCSASKL